MATHTSVHRLFAGLLSTSIIATIACGGGGGGGGGATPSASEAPDVSLPTVTTGTTSQAVLPQSTVGAAGGTIAITDPASPLKGLSVAVPAGATDDPVTFKVSHADVTGATGLPDGSRVAGKLITIEATGSPSWNEQRLFNQPIKVTLPYPAPAHADDVLNVYSLEPDGTMEPTGFSEQDETARTISFYTRTFATTSFDPSAPAASPLRFAPGSKAINTAADAQAVFARYIQVFKDNATVWRSTPTTFPTNFRPSRNGWYIPNKGSFQTSLGNCFGMSSFAKWYFKRGFSPPLHSNYRDPKPTDTWIDDATAIQLAARVQASMSEVFSNYSDYEKSVQQSAKRVVAGILGALYDTKAPVLLSLGRYGELNGTTQRVGGHAVVIYRADIDATSVTFQVYDPNKPGRDDTVPIVYKRGASFDPYNPYGNKDRVYSEFRMAYFAVGLSGAQMLQLKNLADGGFKNDTWFPKVTLDSIKAKFKQETVYDRVTGEKKEGTTADGLHKFITTDKVVVISGNVRGPKVQDDHCGDHNGQPVSCVVDNGYVLYNGDREVQFSINNKPGGDGTFQVEVPLAQGENQFAIVAAKPGFSAWAGYLEDVIDSKASRTDLEVTLTWSTADVDLDLYVQEPDQPAPGTKKGDTVYYRHRNGIDLLHPYLDVDDTRGPGIEHYVGDDLSVTQYTDGTDSTSMYGIYTVRVHYYSDHSGKQPPQQASFELKWRYLAFCPELPRPCADPEATGSWVEKAVSGTLTSPSSSNCCDINGSGPNWSPAFAFDYEQPDPAAWHVPPPSTVMGP